METTLDIIIINYNSGRLLYNCLKSIENNKNINTKKLIIYIVDNNSKDDSIKNIEKKVAHNFNQNLILSLI